MPDVLIFLYVLTAICSTFYVVLLLYMRWHWQQLPTFEIPQKSAKSPFLLSLIVPARNEEENIEKCLSSLCRQNYPKNAFEIIVVDDHSDDQTFALIEKVKTTYPEVQLQCYRLADFGGNGKKKALSLGIAQSKGQWILTTDADCESRPQRLAAFMAFLKQNPTMRLVSGPVFFKPSSKTNFRAQFFAKMQILELHALIAMGGAFIQAGQARLCNGANLAFERAAYEKVGGYEPEIQIASGDDEFLMARVAKAFPGKIGFLKTPHAAVETTPITALTSFLNQRKRWAAKTKFYQSKTTFLMMAMLWLYHLALLVSLPIAFFHSGFWLVFGGLMLGKMLGECLFLQAGSAFFQYGKKALSYYFPAAFAYIPYVLWVGLGAGFGNYQWKSRKFKS